MAKDAFWFSHDMNARHDLKILSMRSVYGSEGYGWFWIIIEMLRSEQTYKLNISTKYAFHAIAKELETSVEKCIEFVNDCIEEFGLLVSDGQFIWSPSLMARLELMEEKKQRRVEAGRKGGLSKSEKQKTSNATNNLSNATNLPEQTQSNASDFSSTKLNNTKQNNTIKNEEVENHFSFEVIELIDLFIQLLKSNNPKVKVPTDLKKWHDAIRLMHERDGHSYNEIRSIIQFSQENDFWKSNILSATKLREKKDTLFMQSKQPKRSFTTMPNARINKPIPAQVSESKVSEDEFAAILQKHGIQN